MFGLGGLRGDKPVTGGDPWKGRLAFGAVVLVAGYFVVQTGCDAADPVAADLRGHRGGGDPAGPGRPHRALAEGARSAGGVPVPVDRGGGAGRGAGPVRRPDRRSGERPGRHRAPGLGAGADLDRGPALCRADSGTAAEPGQPRGRGVAGGAEVRPGLRRRRHDDGAGDRGGGVPGHRTGQVARGAAVHPADEQTGADARGC